jgi:hypothetical protein
VYYEQLKGLSKVRHAEIKKSLFKFRYRRAVYFMQMVEMVNKSEEQIKSLLKPEDYISVWDAYPELIELLEEKKKHLIEENGDVKDTDKGLYDDIYNPFLVQKSKHQIEQKTK